MASTIWPTTQADVVRRPLGETTKVKLTFPYSHDPNERRPLGYEGRKDSTNVPRETQTKPALEIVFEAHPCLIGSYRLGQ